GTTVVCSCALRPCLLSLCSWSGTPRLLHSFPTRRSSDLLRLDLGRIDRLARQALRVEPCQRSRARQAPGMRGEDAMFAALHFRPDRKSTRLNSSHDQISYAVFCLKKKSEEYYVYWKADTQ